MEILRRLALSDPAAHRYAPDRMIVPFRAAQEFDAGPKWKELFELLWPAYHAWFLKEGDAARPSYPACRAALRRHMPEIVPTFECLVDLAGGSDSVARCLSLYRPTPYLTGCSQAVWMRREPMLVRNYDYHPKLWDGVLWHTAWNGRQVIAMSDCLWGLLDGINEDGLVVSLSFGGRKVVGDGFGIPLVLRYVLETCGRVSQAIEVLQRVPSHMSYNVTLVDAAGNFATVFVAPDRPAIVTRRPLATNHQRTVEWSQYAHATASLERERFLASCLEDPHETPERFATRFLEPPLFSTAFAQGWGTLYTATYRPLAREAIYGWPGYTCWQSFERFTELLMSVEYRA
ncbi:MAG: C45 family autoproteolytic acyltransferase/hydrolase [Phycisphaerae bacterium]|nr:C45 family autoproteolytic acyltransferase/hydrolase [Phycisphaerae bacterium]